MRDPRPRASPPRVVRADAARPARRHLRDLARHPRRPGGAGGGRDRHARAGRRRCGASSASTGRCPCSSSTTSTGSCAATSGTSLYTTRPIADDLASRLPATIELTLVAMVALGRRRHPARRRLRALAQLRARPRPARRHRLRPRHRELLARHHAAAPVRHAPRLDAAQRPARGLPAARGDRPLPGGRGARRGTGRPSRRRSGTSRCPRPRSPSRRSPPSCASRGPACSR